MTLRPQMPAGFGAPALLCVLGALLLGGCESARPQPQARPTPAPQEDAPAPRVEQPAVDRRSLEDALAKEQAARKAVEELLARSTARVLERDAQIRDLRERQAALQERLDDAILEVVRAKGKLRSLESRAEAASNLAEAEIAFKALTGQPRTGETGQILAKAEQLLRMSTEEFKKENYGGALYLANEAKSRLSSASLRTGSRAAPPAAEGESPLVAPLPVEAIRTCNLREGPGTEFKIVGSLPAGARAVVQAQKGQWVRITCSDGTTGWVFQNLVAPQ